LKELSY